MGVKTVITLGIFLSTVLGVPLVTSPQAKELAHLEATWLTSVANKRKVALRASPHLNVFSAQ